MNGLQRLRLAWLQAEGGPDDPLLAALRAEGLQLRRCAPGQEGDAQLRLLSARLVDAPEAWRQPLPSLVIATSADEEAQLLARLPPQADVVRGRQPLDLLLLRLQRLADAAGLVTHQAPEMRALQPCLDSTAWSSQVVHALAAPQPGVSALLMLRVTGLQQLSLRGGAAQRQAGGDAIARLLQRQLAPADRLGRLGLGEGERFGLLLRRYDAASLLRDAEALRASLAALSLPTSTALRAHAGLAWARPGAGFGELLALADAALTQAGLAPPLCSLPALPPEAAAAPAGLCALTQACDQAHLAQRLQREAALADAQRQRLSLLLVDPRGLQALNQREGVAAGDLCLQALAAQLRQQARLTDWVARVQGGCLGLLMPQTDEAGAEIVRARLQAALPAGAHRLLLRTRPAGSAPLAWLRETEAALQALKGTGVVRAA